MRNKSKGFAAHPLLAVALGVFNLLGCAFLFHFWQQQNFGNPSSPTPASPISFDVRYCGGMLSEGLLGEYGWSTDLPSPATITRAASPTADRNHPCGLLWSTGSSAGNYAATEGPFYCDLGTVGVACSANPGSNPFGPLNNVTFDSWFVVQPVTISTSVGTKMQFGFYDWVGGSVPINSLYVRYSKVSGDTNWMGVACASSVCTATSLGIAPVQGDWTHIHIFSTTPGTIQFAACNSVPPAICTPPSPIAITTNVPTTGMIAIFDIENEATAAVRAVEFERFMYYQAIQ